MKIEHRRDYREARRAEYPDIGDQLDAIMKLMAADPYCSPELKRLAEQCQAVKTKYPKPNP